jgi:putative addiction module component (TIGR02574 family)
MPHTLESLGIDRLSIEERVGLVQAIWDSIVPQAAETTLSDSQKAEVDRRLAAHEADPSAAIPWEQIESDALARLQR